MRRRVFLHVTGIAEPLNVIALLFGNELRWFESQYRHFLKVYLGMFYTHKHSNCAVTHPLCNYTFQKLSLLHWQS